MQIKLLALLILICACASCAPEKKCSGKLVYDDSAELCIPCPKNATFKSGTCICMAGYDYVNFRCVKGDAGPDVPVDAGPTPDTGMASGGASCQDYCSFANECIGQNALAGALSDIVTGLHADNTGACNSSCQGDLGSKEASDPALTCFASGKAGTMCKDPNPQMGLKGAFGLIEECCGTRSSDPLCKSICKTLKASPIVGSMVGFCP